MNIVRSFVLLVFLCVLAVQLGTAQTAVSIKIYGTELPSGGYDSVTIGVHPSASAGIDTALGEAALPPPGLGFDFRSVTLPTWDAIEGGSYVNLHRAVYDGQKDRYKLAFQRDSGNTGVRLSWQSGLGALSGGYWIMQDDGGVTTSFGTIDMTTQTSVDIPLSTQDPAYLTITKGDGMGLHTATYDELQASVDSKGKAKAEKAKPYNSEAEFTFTLTAGNGGTGSDSKIGLYVEYSQGILDESINPPATESPAPTPDGKTKKITYTFSSTLHKDSVNTVTIFAHGAKGKDLVVKKYWWIPQVPGDKWKAFKVAGPVPTADARLWLKMPNWHNIGEEMYTEPGGPALPNGILLGLTDSSGADAKGKPYYKYVYHPKYKDAMKTTGAGKTKITDAARCLDQVNGKDVKKGLKSAPQGKGGNLLIANMLTLKFNVYSSSLGHMGAGNTELGNCYINSDSLPWATDDITVNELLAKADSVLSCKWNAPAITPAQLQAAMEKINAMFSATFDTASWSGVKTVLTEAKKLVEQNLLYRQTISGSAPLVAPGNYYSQIEQPLVYRLQQNYPNPFNPSTTIQFELPEDAFVTLKVYNALGQEVVTLADHELFTEGENWVEFDGSGLASGVYFYRLIVEGGKFQQVMKMMLLK